MPTEAERLAEVEALLAKSNDLVIQLLQGCHERNVRIEQQNRNIEVLCQERDAKIEALELELAASRLHVCTAIEEDIGDMEDSLSDARGVVESLLEECRGSSSKLLERIEDAEQWLIASRELRDRPRSVVALKGAGETK